MKSRLLQLFLLLLICSSSGRAEWMVKEYIDPLTDEVRFKTALALDREGGAIGVACFADGSLALVSMSNYLGREGAVVRVRWRVNDAEPYDEVWEVSGRFAFTRRAPDINWFLRDAKGAEERGEILIAAGGGPLSRIPSVPVRGGAAVLFHVVQECE